jgi:hypothetical protein
MARMTGAQTGVEWRQEFPPGCSESPRLKDRLAAFLGNKSESTSININAFHVDFTEEFDNMWQSPIRAAFKPFVNDMASPFHDFSRTWNKGRPNLLKRIHMLLQTGVPARPRCVPKAKLRTTGTRH